MFGKSFDVKNIFGSYQLITERNLQILKKYVNRRLPKEALEQRQGILMGDPALRDVYFRLALGLAFC